MSAAPEQIDPLVELARAHAVLDALAGLDLTGLADDELLAYGREKERLRRRLAASDHAFVLEVEARALPSAVFVRSPGSFLRGLLRLDPHEAHQRVQAAHAAGRRRALNR